MTLHEPLGLAPRPSRHLSCVGLIAARALHRLGEEPDARQRGPKLVAHFRDEVGLQLAQVGLAPQEHEDEHDARDGDEDEADREHAEEEVEHVADEHEHDPDEQDERGRDDDQEDEELDDASVPRRCRFARRTSYTRIKLEVIRAPRASLRGGPGRPDGQPELERQRTLAREHPEAVVAPETAAARRAEPRRVSGRVDDVDRHDSQGERVPCDDVRHGLSAARAAHAGARRLHDRNRARLEFARGDRRLQRDGRGAVRNAARRAGSAKARARTAMSRSPRCTPSAATARALRPRSRGPARGRPRATRGSASRSSSAASAGASVLWATRRPSSPRTIVFARRRHARSRRARRRATRRALCAARQRWAVVAAVAQLGDDGRRSPAVACTAS